MKGRADAMVDAVLATLRLRGIDGIDVPANLSNAVRRTADLALDAVLAAALACADADDFGGACGKRPRPWRDVPAALDVPQRPAREALRKGKRGSRLRRPRLDGVVWC